MAEIIELPRIAGVKLVRLNVLSDERGRFLETFRQEWFPERTWERVQTNRSDSRAGVLRGLHYHFHQVDYWYAARGRIRVGLADLRKNSPTFGASETIELGDHNECGLYIPSGVAHGFYALTDATLTYLVDNYYDGSDEFGVAWDDPDLAVPWNVSAPIVSTRDRNNPRLRDIPAEQRP
jgi:dTDP-4-dehydrorhamnose 3,5-epimerase